MIEIHSKERLASAIENTEMPVSFLFGAPLSWDGTHGVPPVSGMVRLVRETIEARRSGALAEFDALVGDNTGPEAYQVAMSFLQSAFDPAVVSTVVQRAVLNARRAGAPTFDFSSVSEGSPDEWAIPAGIDALARLIRSRPDFFTGPILTTNFDPLIELALQEAGLRPHRNVVPAEGSVDPTKQYWDEVDVVHLHGYWRNSSTLHTPAQLRSSREQLAQSLQSLLRQRLLVVMAYGGWDDVVTLALARALSEPGFGGSIRWCFYGSNAAEIRENNLHLFTLFRSGIASGTIQFYYDVDCHQFLPELLAKGGAVANIPRPEATSPLPGWETLDIKFLDDLEPLQSEEAVRYFDGAVPSWRHATSALIPRLSGVKIVTTSLDRAQNRTDASVLQLVLAAGGEGKSTVIQQVAVDATRSGLWRVLFRPAPELGMSPDVVMALDPQENWLIVVDDAETIIDDLWLCATRLHRSGRSNIYFLLAARDTDWRAKGGYRKSWENWLRVFEPVALGALSAPDAQAIATAWEVHGTLGLRALQDVAVGDRAVFLMSKAQGEKSDLANGSMLGALLEARFDEAGLTAHIRTVLERLSQISVQSSCSTLLHAILYPAMCQAAGLDGVGRNVLATLLNVPREWVGMRVVRPLGAELGAAEANGLISTRHSRVASAILLEAEKGMDIDLGEAWAVLMRETARLSREDRSAEIHGAILHAGPRIFRTLPAQLGAKRRQQIAIQAARASVAWQPEWLSCVIDLARTFREAGLLEDAIRVLEEYHDKANSDYDYRQQLTNYSEKTRGYFVEWSTVWGKTGTRDGYVLDSWLASLSLSDQLVGALTLRDIKLACAGLGVSFGNLMKGPSSEVYAKARRAVTEFGWKTDPDAKAMRFFSHHDRELEKAGIPAPTSTAEALSWLMCGTQQIYAELTNKFYKEIISSGKLTFKQLHKALA